MLRIYRNIVCPISYEGELDFDLSLLNPNMIPSSTFNDVDTFVVEDTVVWVDPLDGTLSYVKEEYDAVTTLIGVSVANEPIIGIIG